MGFSWKRLDATNAFFLGLTHLAAVVAVGLYATVLPWSWATAGMAAALLFATSLSITGGYHRLFAHRSYQCHPLLRAFYLAFGAAAFQNSAINWSADHRRHHASTDTDDDPYSIRKGFLWAHIGWVLNKTDPPDPSNVPDLCKDPLVAFQHRYYVPVGILFGFALPTALAACWGDPLGGFLLAGWMRLLLQFHATFSVNSVAHTIGAQPYDDSDSSRDSVVTALVTLGEGYHNYHHTFPSDYRNGVRAWQFDPTKWIVSALSWVGVTWGLKTVPDELVIRQKIKMDMRRMILTMHESAERSAVWQRRFANAREQWEQKAHQAREQLEGLLGRWAAVKAELASLKAEMSEQKARLGGQVHHELARLKHEVRAARAEFRRAHREWAMMCRRPELVLAK